MLHENITEIIIKAFYDVYNTLGYGFLEKVYENALTIELNKESLQTRKQTFIPVLYNGKTVGEYFADIIVNDLVIIEIKATERLREEHGYQLLNYLKATDKEVGLLQNFGKTPEFERIIFTNDRKTKRLSIL